MAESQEPSCKVCGAPIDGSYHDYCQRCWCEALEEANGGNPGIG